MASVFTMKGVQDMLDVFEDKVTITPKGILGFLNKGAKGTKTIPLLSITAIQLKEAGIFRGYIQFTLLGGNESRGGILAAAKDENSVLFTSENNGLATQIKEYVESKTRELRAPQAIPSGANLSDELQKMATLREQGILSDEEFQAVKRKLLGGP